MIRDRKPFGLEYLYAFCSSKKSDKSTLIQKIFPTALKSKA